MDKVNLPKISVIVPVFNEEKIIKETLDRLINYLNNSQIEYEVIVINDGSGDNTKNIIENYPLIKIINHPYNKGYGASLKSGALNSCFDWLLFYDGDGQHSPEYIGELVKHISQYDMIIGRRDGYQTPWIRRPGKSLLTWLANYLVDFKIPDLNSGYRLVNKKLFNRFLNLYPNNFSLTTTITLAAIKEGSSLKYIPIKINKRTGVSTVGPRHALDTFILISRMITLFSPLRFFFPLSLLTASAAVVFVINDIFQENISDSTVLLFVATIFIFFFGLILDQIAAVRRELNK